MTDIDQHILELLDTDRDAGTAALLRAYTGLLRSVCARRLDDEEDVKECVNDVFVEFIMIHRLCQAENYPLLAHLFFSNYIPLERKISGQTRKNFFEISKRNCPRRRNVL